MKEFIITTIIILSIIIIPIFLLNTINYLQCRNNITEMNKEYRYSLINGCRLQLDDGTYIYWKMYRQYEQ